MSTKFDEFFSRLKSATDIDSQSDLARALDVTRSAISLAKKKDTVSARWILDLAQMYTVDPLWLETGRGDSRPASSSAAAYPLREDDSNTDSEYVRIPKVVARLSAGGGSFETTGMVEGYHSFRADWIRSKGNPRNMVLMQVVGNSMEPEIHEGDLVLVDQSKVDVLSGGIYAVGVEDTVMVKRIEKLPGQLVLHSDNTDYRPIHLRGDELLNVRVIGKVLWASREYH